MKDVIKKAEILVEALPYIQALNGKTVVIKYGGNAMINEELKNSVMEDITWRRSGYNQYIEKA